MPPVSGILETSIYAEDLDRVAQFYEELFGWKAMFNDSRLRAYAIEVRDEEVP